MKETLSPNKLKDLFGQNAGFVEVFDYDTGCLLHNKTLPVKDAEIYKSFRNILKNDARFNNSYELVAVVSLSICPHPYADSPFLGRIVRNPRYVQPNKKFLGATGFAGNIICRDKKTGKILPVSKKWFYSLTRHCVQPGQSNSGLPGLADVIDADIFCGDYDTYEKLIRINVFERQR